MKRSILLDTNALLRLVRAPNSVAPAALAVLKDPESEVHVSAISAWEISIKTRLGRLDGEPLLSTWHDALERMAMVELGVDSPDGILAGRLPWQHHDPFDRMLVAQATRRNLTIATSDARLIESSLTATLDTR